MTTKELTKKFPLAFPFEYKGENVTEITLRRPKVREVKAMATSSKNSFEDTVDMIAELAGKPVEMIDEIDPEDYKPMQDWVGNILGK